MFTEKSSESKMRFVACAVYGGLGNQLFQWAAGFALAQRHRCPLFVDRHEGTDCFGREFLLARLGLECELLGEERRKRLLGRSAGFLTLGLWDRIRCDVLLRRRVVEREPAATLRTLQRVRPPVYLVGHFQSEKFFLGYSEQIRAHLRRAVGLDGGNAEPSMDAIAVHVRRGDYTLPGVASVLGLCGVRYYTRALEMLREWHGARPVHVFTDDPAAWQSQKFAALRACGAELVSGPDAVEDFRRLCRYRFLVMSNSTFSWWAAWLAQAQAVVRPRPWFNDPHKDKYFDCPERWIALERS